MLALLIHRCSIVRLTPARDAEGGPTFTDEVIRSDVHCRIQPASGSDKIEFKRRNLDVSHAIYFASDPQVSLEHVITFVRGSNTVRLRVVDHKNFDEVNAAAVSTAIPNYWKVMALEGTED